MTKTKLQGNNSAQDDSGYSSKDRRNNDCRRSNWRPTNLNLERFTLDECSNMTQTHKYSVGTNSERIAEATSTSYQHHQDVESGRRSPATTSSKSIGPHGVNTTSTANVTANQAVDRTFTINYGWLTTCLVGLACLTFLLCIYLIPSQNIYPVAANLQEEVSDHHQLLRRKGNLRVYPTQVSEEAIRRNAEDSFIIPTNPEKFNIVSQSLQKIISEYNRSNCDEDLPQPYVNCYLQNPTPSTPCIFERTWLGKQCTPETNYGYKEINGYINPCFLVRLLNTEDWYPENWSQRQMRYRRNMKHESSFIALTCSTQRYKDRHKIKIIQNPMKGFAQDFFPFSDFKAAEYIYPAVMVQIHDLKVRQNITITCSLRARNAYVLRDGGRITISFQGQTHTPMSNADKKPMAIESTQDPSSSSSLITSHHLIASTKPPIIGIE